MAEDTFKEKIDNLAAGTPETGTPEQPVKKARGRPVGFSPKAAKEAAERAAVDAAKVVPPVNEMEAALFAEMFSGVANMFVKKEYRDKLNFTKEEFLNITRPAVQLKAYYIPNFGGIYSIWLQFGLAAGGLGLAKYKIITEIMEKENPQLKKITDEQLREKNNFDTGNQGNGQINESQGIVTIPPEGTNI